MFVGLLLAVCVASVVVVVVLGTSLTFFNDDWYFLLQRPGIESHGGLDALVAPHNSNLVFLPALAYKVLVALFGLGSQLPFRLLLGISIAAVGALVFLLVRVRAGDLVALACAAVVLFLGAAWEDLLFFASIDLVGSLAMGLGALWALERDTPRRNAVACLLLVCSVACSNVGVPFAGAAAIAIALRGRVSQLWIPIVPVAVFGLWWGLDGNRQPSHLSTSNVEHLPRYVFDSASAGLASVTGLNRGTVSGTYSRGHILLAVVAGVLVAWLLWGWRPRPTVLVPVGAALTFWILTGASFIPGREPFASRYQLIDAALLLLIWAELLRGVHIGAVAGSVVLAISAAIIWSNIDSGLTHGYRFLRDQSGFVKAELGALELGRRFAPANLWLTAQVARNPYLSGVTAGRFFAETDAHGRLPAYAARQIAAAPPLQRQAADSVLAFSERLPPIRTAESLPAKSDCIRLHPDRSGLSPAVVVRPGTWLISDVGRAGLAIGARRFARPDLPVYVGLIAPGWRERLTIPSDSITLPWRLSLRAPPQNASAALEVCPL